MDSLGSPKRLQLLLERIPQVMDPSPAILRWARSHEKDVSSVLRRLPPDPF